MSNLGPGTKTNPPHASSARLGSGWLPGCLPTAALSFWEVSANKPLPCPAANTHPKAVDFRAGSQPIARPTPSRSDAQSFPGPPPMGYGPAGTGAGPVNRTRLKIHSASGILLFYCSLVCAHRSRYHYQESHVHCGTNAAIAGWCWSKGAINSGIQKKKNQTKKRGLEGVIFQQEKSGGVEKKRL